MNQIPAEFAPIAHICKATEMEIGGRIVLGVHGRDLYAGLQVKRDFTTWMKARLAQCGFREGVDFQTIDFIGPQNGGVAEKVYPGVKVALDYRLTLHVAKHLAMLEKNERGQLARRYFIWCEEDRLRAMEAPTGITAAMLKSDPRLMMEMLLHNTQRVIELEETTKTLEAEKETMAEDVKAFEVLTKSEGSLTITDAAKDLGVRRVKLIEWLKANGWIYRRLGNAEWVGYQVREKAGLVDHVMNTYRGKSGEDHCCSQVRITPKGQKELALRLRDIQAGT